MHIYELPALKDRLEGRRTFSILIEKYESVKHLVEDAERIVVLSSPLAFPGFVTFAQRIPPETFEEIVEWAEKLGIPIISFHGHQATLDVVGNLTGVRLEANRASYTPREGDLVVAIRLKKRLEKPEDIKDVKKDEIEFILLQYAKITTSDTS